MSPDYGKGMLRCLLPTRRLQNWQTVLRSGFGIFYDLATSEVGNTINTQLFPFGATKFLPPAGGTSTYPLTSTDASPPPISPSGLLPGVGGAWGTFDPHLELPYTLEWNTTLEQGLGFQQSISTSYVGARGRRLLQSARVNSPNANFGFIGITLNSATSDYDALQLQFRKKMPKGLQALASYSWSHSIDTASAGSLFGNQANALLTTAAKQNRGASDFDIRNAFSVGLTYEVPASKRSAFINRVLSTQSVFQARSAVPVNVFDGAFNSFRNQLAEVRPDLEPGIPLYLFGSQFPGGKALNNTLGAVSGGCPDRSSSVGPFCPPPTDANGNPIRQGNLGRNALRGFGAWQWDFAVHRDFPIIESLTLQFRVEMFNVLNHPNFAPPMADVSNPTQFGLSTQTLGNFLAGGAGGNVGNGGFNPLYQIGGPRSVQFGLKLVF